MSKLRVAVIGAKGRIGAEAARAVEAADDLDLVAAIDRDDRLEALTEAGAQVAVDLTHPDAVMGNLEFAVGHGIHAVVGTTGWTRSGWTPWRAGWPPRPAPGAGRPELLHRRRPDHAVRPAGGPLVRERRGHRTAPRQQGGRPQRHRHPHRPADRRRPRRGRPRARSSDPTTHGLPGARGAGRGRRARALGAAARPAAHQEVLFGDTGETLTIRHDSLHHSSFMPGILLAVRTVPGVPGLTYGLEHFLSAAGDLAGRTRTRRGLNRDARQTGHTASAVALLFYFVLAGDRGILLIADGRPVTVAFGVAVLVLPLIGAWFLWHTTAVRPARGAARAGAGGRGRPAGGRAGAARPAAGSTRTRPTRWSSRRQAETEAGPDDWRDWFRLAVAYFDARDTPRARKAMQRAIALHDGARRPASSSGQEGEA